MHTELDFENDIEAVLLKNGGYHAGDPAGYDAERALFPADMLGFVEATQPKIWDYLQNGHESGKCSQSNKVSHQERGVADWL